MREWIIDGVITLIKYVTSGMDALLWRLEAMQYERYFKKEA